MNEIFEDIEKVDWQSLETAYGNAVKVPNLLKSLTIKEEKIKLNVSHELWSGLCHQHAYVSSAAEPAFPILLKIFPNVSELVQIEIMDIFVGFAVCTSPNHPEAGGGFQTRLRYLLLSQVELFESLSKHSNKQIASFAETIVEFLQTNT